MAILLIRNAARSVARGVCASFCRSLPGLQGRALAQDDKIDPTAMNTAADNGTTLLRTKLWNLSSLCSLSPRAILRGIAMDTNGKPRHEQPSYLQSRTDGLQDEPVDLRRRG